MNEHPDGDRTVRERLIDAGDGVRRAFREFLLIPTVTVSGFLLLAVAMHLLDQAKGGWFEPVRGALRDRLFIDSGTTSDLLAAIAAGIISVTSITISLLLLAVQQGAGSMTSAVFDQFLRRRRNQAYFGFFVGLALYTLVTLSTVHESSNAVLGATLAFGLTVAALYIIIILLYSTVNQMRPVVVIASIHDRTLAARRRQLDLVHRTRRASQMSGLASAEVRASRSGFVVRIDLDALEQAFREGGGSAEIVLRVSVGTFVAWNDLLAEVRGGPPGSRETLSACLGTAIVIERQREIASDPGYGVRQLERIGWTTVSSAKSSPGTAAHSIRALRNFLMRWADERAPDASTEVLPVVYTDTVFQDILDALESMAVASVESMQHQSFAEVLRTLAMTVEHLAPARQQAVVALVERLAPLAGEHIATRDMAEALEAMAAALRATGRPQVATALLRSEDRLKRRVLSL